MPFHLSLTTFFCLTLESEIWGCPKMNTVRHTALVLSTCLSPLQYLTREPKCSQAGDFNDRGGSWSSVLSLAVAMTHMGWTCSYRQKINPSTSVPGTQPCTALYQTERPVPKRFNTNTCIVTPLVHSGWNNRIIAISIRNPFRMPFLYPNSCGIAEKIGKFNAAEILIRNTNVWQL